MESKRDSPSGDGLRVHDGEGEAVLRADKSGGPRVEKDKGPAK